MFSSVDERPAGTTAVTQRCARVTDEAYARYFAEREQFERAMSERARRVAEVHGEMAERYEALAKVFGARSARSSTVRS